MDALDAEVVEEDGLAVHELLRDEAGDREHGDAAVLDLLGGHLRELGRVLGLEAEGVEVDVTGVVLIVEEVEAGALVGRLPAVEGAAELGDEARHGAVVSREHDVEARARLLTPAVGEGDAAGGMLPWHTISADPLTRGWLKEEAIRIADFRRSSIHKKGNR